jgi:branched-chain amino acid transport system substrate-binding protein
MLLTVILGILIAGMPLLVACGSTPTTTSTTTTTGTTPANVILYPDKPLKVGMMTPTTGVPSKGIPGQDGLTDAVKYINDELGGAAGYPFGLLWRDSQYKADVATTIVNDYMNQGALLFTTHSSTEMQFVQGIANENAFPGLVTFVYPGNIHPPAHIYGPTPDYGDDFVAFMKYYKANIWKGTGKPKVALYLLKNPTGLGAQQGARAMADSLGIDVVNLDSPEQHGNPPNTADVTASLTRIKNMNPDVLYMSTIPECAAPILKTAKDMGLFPNTNLTIGLCSAAMTKSMVDLAGADVAEGVYGLFHTVSWQDNVPGIAKAKEYQQKYHPNDVNNMDYLSYWNTTLIVRQILINAVQNAGYDVLAKGDATAWKAVEEQGIKKLNNYDVQGLQGKVSYTPGDNRLSKQLKLYKVSGGQIVSLGDWQDAPLIPYETLSWWGK